MNHADFNRLDMDRSIYIAVLILPDFYFLDLSFVGPAKINFPFSDIN